MFLILGHYDRTTLAFNLYKTIFEGLRDSSEKTSLDLSYNYNGSSETIPVSGDVVFNFNQSKLRYFQYVIDNDNTATNEYKSYVKKLLEICSKFHHSPENITILPKTGAINNIKQSLGNDRPDVFLASLKLYYDGYKSLILSNDKCTPQNMPYLEKFLDSFKGENSICNFSKFIYHIDEKFTIELCEHGKTPIKTVADVHKYILLAYKYWMNTREFYMNHNNAKTKKAYEKLSKNYVLLEFNPYFEDEFDSKIDIF